MATETPVLSTETPVLSTETPQRKEKEIKENEIKAAASGFAGEPENRQRRQQIACVEALFPKSVKAAVARSMAESLSGWLEVFPPAVVGRAIVEALNYNALNLKYICNVLKAWQRQGLHNIGDLERYLETFKKGGNGGANAAANSERVKAKHGIMARDFDFAKLEKWPCRTPKRGEALYIMTNNCTDDQRRKSVIIDNPRRLFILRKEAERLAKELYSLNCDLAYVASASLSLAPAKASGKRSPVEEYAVKKAALEEKIFENKEKIIDEYTRLETAIGAVEDPEARMILRLRIIDGLGWEEIGEELHMHRTTAMRKFTGTMRL
ncbi:MAG: DnaD domain protein [Clostridiales bacterium]|nr:DnaD domain protein [Clostridiales bacterium]